MRHRDLEKAVTPVWLRIWRACVLLRLHALRGCASGALARWACLRASRVCTFCILLLSRVCALGVLRAFYLLHVLCN